MIIIINKSMTNFKVFIKIPDNWFNLEEQFYLNIKSKYKLQKLKFKIVIKKN